MKRGLLTIYFSLLFLGLSLAQSDGFDARVIAGLTAAQIRGDNLAGFNKVGFEGGLGVSYDIRYNMDLAAELLFSQRGSRPDLAFGANASPIFRLNYLSIPVVWSIKDWLNESENNYTYFRVMAEAGLSYGRLLSSEVEGDLGTIGTEELVDAFNQNDISWLIGVGYRFSYRTGIRLRYNRSITKLFKTQDHPDINYNDLVPYHLSIQMTYKL